MSDRKCRLFWPWITDGPSVSASGEDPFDTDPFCIPWTRLLLMPSRVWISTLRESNNDMFTSSPVV